MSDVTGAAAPGGTDAPVLESVADAAATRLASLKADPAFGAKRLAGDHQARNEWDTLMRVVHGGHDDAGKAALAQSIELTPKSSIAAAARAREAAETAAAATRLSIPFEVASKLTPAERANLSTDIGAWANGLSLQASTVRTVLDRVSSEGPKVSQMSPEDQAAWVQRQNSMLDGAAGSKEKADAWRAAAKRVVANSKYATALILNDAFIVRHLALGASRK